MILSIDCGIKNLAMCLFDPESQRIVQWDISGVPTESSIDLYICFRELLDKKSWVLDAKTILIEKQPDRNRKMKTVENFLHAYMVIKNPDALTLIYDARNKVPDVVGPGKVMYRKRKNTAIERCKEFLDRTQSVNSGWNDLFSSSKKKDDLADTIMQALSYRPVKSVTKSKSSEKVRARKPTENQQNTKYSKANLAWILKNEPEKVTSKRFQKDLKRYYTELSELETALE